MHSDVDLQTPDVKDGGPYVNAVSPEFFQTLGVRILRGRGFTAADEASHARVMVVSESMARLIWRGRDPIGQCVGAGADSLPCSTIVGIAENTHRNGVIEQSEVLQYYVQLQYASEYMADRVLFVRPADGNLGRWVEPVRRLLQTTAPNLPFADISPMETLYDWQIQPWRLGATMFAAFGALALLLTALGLYSVVAYAVTQRTHEFGVRIALGASSPRIVGSIVRHGIVLATAGAALGTGIALVAARMVQPMLFQVSAHDPVTFVLVVAILVLVSVIASVLPARRAASVDPVIALKAE